MSMKEYYKKHKVCPMCGNPPSGSTYVGFVAPPDTNAVWCECGWSGITDELVAEDDGCTCEHCTCGKEEKE